MTFIYSNPSEFKLWNKENFDAACGALARNVAIYKTVAQLSPYISFFALSSSPPRCFVPDGLSISNFIKPDSQLTKSISREFESFAEKIPINVNYGDLLYEASLNIISIDWNQDTAIWVGFNRDFGDGFSAKEFQKFVELGRGYFLDANNGNITKLEIPKVKKEFGFFEVKGDIFEGEWDYLVHCANCYHTMGGGIAKVIASHWPEVLEADKETVKDESKIGTYSEADVGGRKVINLYGQSGIGNNGSPLERNARYDAIYNGLYLLFQEVSINDKGAEIAIPAGMACGLAGGSWKVVKAIIQDLQEMFGVRVVIYEKSI